MRLRPKHRQRGFTLMELLIVMTVIALLSTVGLIGYRRSTKVAREGVLKENLFQLNHALEQYHTDRGRYPTSIGQLRDMGYFRKIPEDPFMKSTDTWVAEYEPPDPDNPNSESGIFRVRSASTEVGENGIPYNEW